MSNGVPEPDEGGPEAPPGLHAVLALVYTVAWLATALVALLFGLGSLLEKTWLIWSSVAFLLAAIVVLAREIGFLRAPPGRKRP